MKKRKRTLALSSRRFLALVAILAALTPLSFQKVGVTNAQTDTETPIPGGGGDPGGPAAPVPTTISGPGWINLTWEPVAGADMYDVWRRLGAEGNWQRASASPLTETTYGFIGYPAGTTIFFLVRTIAADGKVSPWSELAQETAIARLTPTPTPTPTETTLTAPVLTATAAGSNAIDLNWTSVPGAVRYELYMQHVDDPSWVQIGGGNLTATSYRHGELTPGKTYQYAVRAIDANDQPLGPWSDFPTATIPASEAPTTTPTPTPTDTATPGPTPTATSTRTPTATATPGPLSTATATATPTTSPTPGPTPTVTSTATPTASPTPGAAPTPTSTAATLTAPVLTATVVGSNEIELSWTSVPGAVRYVLFTQLVDDPGWVQIAGDNLMATSYRHSELTPGKTYQYAVRAIDTSNQPLGPWSDFPTETVPATDAQTESETPVPGGGGDAGGPAAPVLTTSKGPGWTRLSWEPVAGADMYDVRWKTGAGDGWRTPGSNPISGTNFDFYGTIGGTTLYFLVRSIAADGKVSPWSELAQATAIARSTPTPTPTATTAGTALSAPVLTAKALGSNEIELNWTSVPGADRYVLWTQVVNVSGWQQIDGGNLKATSYTHRELTPGATYRYAVRAIDANNQPLGPWSEFPTESVPASDAPTPTPTITATSTPGATPTPTETPPSAPVLTATFLGSNEIELNWTSVPGAVRYVLWTQVVNISGWQQIDGGNLKATSYTHSELTPGATYRYAVRAIDANNQPLGPWSEFPTESVPPSDAPTPTPTLTATSTPTPTPTITATSAPGATPTPTLTATSTPTPTPTETTLSAPVLTATGTGSNAIDLSWTSVPGAVRYELYMQLFDDPGWVQIGGANLTGTSYRHGELTPGKTYQYAVRAIDANDQPLGPWSDFPTETIPASDAPTTTPTPTATVTPTATATPTSGPTPTPTITPTVATTERGALVALYNSTGGVNWKHNDNWLTDEPINTWYGVFTNDEGHVNRLSLNNNGLRGPLPDLSALSNLTSLVLMDNQLTGPIPNLSALTNLNYLFLYSNDLTGPIPDLSALTNLRYLYLFSNDLSGPIPDLSALTILSRLYLNGNELSGPIPDLSALTNLYYLSFRANKLTGPIPDLSALTRLVQLSLGNNNLTGEIPALGALTRLLELSLANNELTGEIPDLSALTRLENLFLNNNELTGNIPNLDNLSYLEALDLSSNELSGPIPDLGNLSNLKYLELANNDLSGEIPALKHLTGLVRLGLESNRLSGHIPDLDALSLMNIVDLSHNQLTGQIPDLSTLNALTNLNLSNNQLTGPILDVNLLTKLRRLDLNTNQLTGPFPDLSALASLSSLNLRGNRLCRPAGVDLAGSNSVVTSYLNSLNLPTCTDADLAVVPDTPQNLTATVSTDQVTLTWDAVANAASYDLQAWDSFERLWSAIGSALTTSSFTHSVQTDGRNYYYQVRTRNANDVRGNWSEQLYVAVVSTQFPPPPASLGLEMYYQKYMVVSGVEVVAPSLATDEQMIRLRAIVTGTLANRSDLLATLAANNTRVYIQDRFKGIAFSWVAYTPVTDPYCDTFIHEFAHLVHHAAEEQSDGAEFNTRLRTLYQAALNSGLWRGYYAATNFREYWAETVKFWLWESLPSSLVANYAKLADYDPEIATFIEETLGEVTIPSLCKP